MIKGFNIIYYNVFYGFLKQMRFYSLEVFIWGVSRGLKRKNKKQGFVFQLKVKSLLFHYCWPNLPAFLALFASAC